MTVEELFALIPHCKDVPYEGIDDSIRDIEDVWERYFREVRNMICNKYHDKGIRDFGFSILILDEKDEGLHSLLPHAIQAKGFRVTLQNFMPQGMYGYGTITVDLRSTTGGIDVY